MTLLSEDIDKRAMTGAKANDEKSVQKTQNDAAVHGFPPSCEVMEEFKEDETWK